MFLRLRRFPQCQSDFQTFTAPSLALLCKSQMTPFIPSRTKLSEIGPSHSS